MKKNYQDYVIKDGKFIGDFDGMYQNCDDPWEQSLELNAIDKIIAIEMLKKLNLKNAIELGSGFGHFLKMLNDVGINSSGVEISNTAVLKSKLLYPNLINEVGDVDHFLKKAKNTNVLVLADVSWYILPELHKVKNFLNENKEIYLCHILTTYPSTVQKYGIDYFFDLNSILSFFNLNYEYFGEIGSTYSLTKRTIFIGKSK